MCCRVGRNPEETAWTGNKTSRHQGAECINRFSEKTARNFMARSVQAVGDRFRAFYPEAMGRPWLSAPTSDLLWRSLWLFLPISGVISLVLLPMVALYEHSRRETVQARVEGLVEAGSGQVQLTLQEVAANTGVITTVPAMSEVLASDRPSTEARQRLVAVFRSQLREYPRFDGFAVFGRQGQALASLSRDARWPASAVLAMTLRGAALQRGQIWFSPVQQPARGAPHLLAARPLISATGDRLGTLLALVSLSPLIRDFNRITNAAPALQRGYLVSGDGRAINSPPGAGRDWNVATRFPVVWRQIQRQRKGVVRTDQGLFLFDSIREKQPLAVLIQVSHAALDRTSVFTQPAGLALVALLYGLVAAGSVGIASYRRHLEDLQEKEHRLQHRLEAVYRNGGIGMCLCDPLTGRFLSVNSALCEFFERGEADLLQCTWQQLTHPDDLDTDQKLAARLHRGDLNRYRLRKRFLRADGTTIWGDLVVSCSRHPDGTIDDLIGQISDVTELVAKSAYLEAASDAGVVGVWDWDIPRDVLSWDPVMYRLYGLRAEDFKGTREAWEKAVHPEDKAFVVQELQAALRGWREYQPRFRVIWPDGSIHTIQARSRISFRSDGTPSRMIGVNYDITEQVEREREVEQQRQLLSTTIDALVDPLLFLTLAQPSLGVPQLRMAQINPAAAAFFGRSEPQLLGQPLTRVLPEVCNKGLHQSLMAIAQGGPPWLVDEFPVQLSEEQEPLFLDVRASNVRQGVVLSFRDVSERRLGQRRLADSEERLRLLAENASDVVFRGDLNGVTEWITPSVTTLVGWTPEDLQGRPFAEFVHPDDLPLLTEVRASFRRGERRQFRLRVRHKQGGYRWVGVNARGVLDGNGTVVGLVGSWRDTQAEVEAEAELDRRARIDPLTGLFNRQEIFERLKELAQRRRSSDGALAVLFCDIDHFKEINDRYGHGGGDRVLQALAERLRQSTRHGDLVGRIGGDELLVVLQAVPSLEAALAIASNIHDDAHAPVQMSHGGVVPTLSIGVTLIQPEETIDAVVARADQAMYEAKSGGRDRVIAIQ